MKVLWQHLLVAGALAAGVLGCNPNSIGRPCVNPNGDQVKGTQVSSPALECPSRLCLLQPTPEGSMEQPRATCTANCQHDSDCEAETKEKCEAGFVCAVATTTGPFCCQKLCVCKDDLQVNKNVDNNGDTITPPACDPAINSQLSVTCPGYKP